MLLPSPGGAGPQGPASTLSRVQGPRAPGGVEGPKALVGSGAKPRSRRFEVAAPKAPATSLVSSVANSLSPATAGTAVDFPGHNNDVTQRLQMNVDTLAPGLLQRGADLGTV